MLTVIPSASDSSDARLAIRASHWSRPPPPSIDSLTSEIDPSQRSRRCPSTRRRRSSRSACLRAVMSRSTAEIPVDAPVGSRMSESASATSISLPFLWTSTVSRVGRCIPPRTSAICSSTSERRLSGTNRTMGLPQISSALYPSSRSAPGFQVVRVPARSIDTMASSDDDTMAASHAPASHSERRPVRSRITARVSGCSGAPSGARLMSAGNSVLSSRLAHSSAPVPMGRRVGWAR